MAIPHFSSPLRRSNEQVGLFLAFIVKVVAFAFALISGVFMIGVLFSFAIWVLTGQHAAFLSMLDFLVWGSLSSIPMGLIHYYADKFLHPDPAPKKLPDGRYALAKLPAPR